MAKTSARKHKDPSYGLITAFILAAAFALRMWGISFGLPDLYHADEPIVVNHALAYGSGDFHPHFFKIPPLVSYLLAGCYGLYFAALRLSGFIQGVADFQNLFLEDPASFYLIARVIFGAAAGTLTVYLFYKLIAKYFSPKHGLLASFFLAFSFLHIRDCHYIYADIPLLLVIVSCFFFIFQVLKAGDRKGYVFFGILFGTAVATKYNGVFLFVPFAAAHFLRKGFRVSSFVAPDFLLAGILSLLTFGLLNPFSWLDGQSFFNELFMQAGAEGFSGWFHHLRYSLAGGIGIPLFALSAAGLLLLFMRPSKERWVLAIFIFTYYVVLVFFSQHYDRYALPLIPFLSFFAADCLLEFEKRMRLPKFVLCLAAIAAICLPLAKAVLSDQIFSRKDVRTVVRERAESVIPAGSKVALDVPFFMPRLKPSVKQLEEKRAELLAGNQAESPRLKRLELMLEGAKTASIPRYELYFLSGNPSGETFLFSKPSVPYDVNRLKALGVEYVFFAKINKAFEPAFYKDLKQTAALLARFSPYKDASREWPIDSHPLTGGPFLWKELQGRERNGQIIELYKLKV